MSASTERKLHDDVGPADDSAAVEAEIAACHAELVHLRELRRALPEPLIERDDYLFEKGLVDKRLAAAEAKRPAPAPYVEPELTDLSAAELRLVGSLRTRRSFRLTNGAAGSS